MDRQIYTIFIFIFIRLTVKMMMHHDGLNIDFNDREELSTYWNVGLINFRIVLLIVFTVMNYNSKAFILISKPCFLQ